MSEPAQPIILTTKDGYDRWATIYDADPNPLIALEEPQVDAMLTDVTGLTIADIGCGTGRHACRLAARGAKVTALDFSPGMLAQARTKPGGEQVNFVEHDLAHPLPLPDRSFDRVLCALVLDHVANLDALFSELGRIVTASGFIVVSIMHPAMMLKGVQARFVDPASGIETRPTSVPNQLSDYINALLRANLKIEHISEHAVDEELAQRLPRAVKHLGWPMLLMLKLGPAR